MDRGLAPSRAFDARSLAAFVGCAVALAALIGIGGVFPARADEQLWAFARGAETLPKGKGEAYQFFTFRTGKRDGDYYAFDFDTEVEYGFTDQIQASVAVTSHYFDINDVEDLRDQERWRFGGVEGSVKGRVLSPFVDPVGLAFRAEGGWLKHDDVAGIRQNEWFFAPEALLQKNFRDDTISLVLNGGAEFAWGKQPAEEYSRELSLLTAAGAAWRFAPNWFLGAEAKLRAEWPMMNLEDKFEHMVLYTGPSIHYGTQRWWVTASWLYQAYGRGIEEGNQHQTFAEEQEQIARLKFGVNF